MLQQLYKQQKHNTTERQEQRRQQLLEEQRRKRLALQDRSRPVPVLDTTQTRHNHTDKKTRTFQEKYKCSWTLQFSEWLCERPADLAEWYLVPCPRGQRCIVVAHNRRTIMYSKTGRHCFSFRSQLPGDAGNTKQFTVLDCIYHRELDSFYVLDVLSYGSQAYIECDAEFRFFWLIAKFDENEAVTERSEHNQKPFRLLRHFDCIDDDYKIKALQKYPYWHENIPQLDGFLFYHKEASYVCGRTPLVCWLFPFMVKEILGLPVSVEYQPPADYQGAAAYMQKFDEQLARKSPRHTKDDDMQISTDEECAVEEDVCKLERNLELDELADMTADGFEQDDTCT